MKRIATWLAVLMASLAAGAAGAQPYPSKPVKIVVGFAPGGGSDFIARVIAQKLTERLGAQVIVENRPGAGSVLGSEYAIKSPADGYHAAPHPRELHRQSSVYKLFVRSDRRHHAQSCSSRAGPTWSRCTLRFRRRRCRSWWRLPKRSRTSRLCIERKRKPRARGDRIFSVHGEDKNYARSYKGTGPALNDTIGGSVQMILGSVATGPAAREIRALEGARVTTPKRIAAAPDVPTVGESGYPSYEVTNWHGLVGPRGLSKDIVERLNKEANEAVKSKDAEKVLAGDGLEPAGGSAAEFAAHQKGGAAGARS